MATALKSNSEETDNVSAQELHSNRRMLYFSDGVMEELSSDSETEADVPDKAYNVEMNMRELPLGPRLRYKACRMGSNILAGIDYIGGGLASFLGITTPKYASELEYHKRSVSEQQAHDADEDLDNWQPTHNNNKRENCNEVIVLCAPAPTHSTDTQATRQ